MVRAGLEPGISGSQSKRPGHCVGGEGKTRKKQHIRNVKICKTGSNIAAHAWRNNHSIDFNNARVIDKGNFRIQKTLESWHIAYTDEADNNLSPSLCQNNTLFL